jgi:TatD DNase family protein
VFFIDTHCHLNFETFDEKIDVVVQNALSQGVKRVIVPGVDLASSEKALMLAKKNEIVYAAVGVHPSDHRSYQKDQFKRFLDLAKEPKVVAIGEIGLDFYHHPETEHFQNFVLEQMLELAQTIEKPIILHSRNALPSLIKKVQQWKQGLNKTKSSWVGVFHAFEGNSEQAEIVKEMGCFLGIGGPVTYINAAQKQAVVKKIGLTSIVLETDSPFLSPHPYRGQENEPSRIPIIAQKVADLLELSIAEVALTTSTNAQSLFRMD